MSVRSGPERTKHGKVLIIDDDEIALQAIADIVELGGYEVHPLVSPIGATQVIATQGIIAAVIDLNMPVMRGDRFISLVRSWDRIRDLPIVLISGESSSAIREAAAQLPGVAVVTKTQMSEQLVRTLRQELQGRPSAQDLGSSPSMGVPIVSHRSVPSAPQRSLAQQARVALAAFRDFTARRPGALPSLQAAFGELRAEAQLVGANNTIHLVLNALELIELCSHRREVPSEVDAAITEMLNMLISEGEKGRGFDQSLALTLHRSRLERIRQSVK